MPGETGKQEACDCLNELLVELFHDILEIEECAVRQATDHSLTMTEIHTLIAIRSGDQSMSEIAGELGVTISTLTTAVNKLENKGFVKRERDAADRRVVHICLTARGRAMANAHERFHRSMTKAAIDGLSEEETDVLARTVKKLTHFFCSERDKMEHKEE